MQNNRSEIKDQYLNKPQTPSELNASSGSAFASVVNKTIPGAPKEESAISLSLNDTFEKPDTPGPNSPGSTSPREDTIDVYTELQLGKTAKILNRVTEIQRQTPGPNSPREGLVRKQTPGPSSPREGLVRKQTPGPSSPREGLGRKQTPGPNSPQGPSDFLSPWRKATPGASTSIEIDSICNGAHRQTPGPESDNGYHDFAAQMELVRQRSLGNKQSAPSSALLFSYETRDPRIRPSAPNWNPDRAKRQKEGSEMSIPRSSPLRA